MNKDYDAVYYTTDSLSIAEYTELLNVIQAENSFGSMIDGANIKYVNSDFVFSLSASLDTRDASVFTCKIVLRGLRTVAFACENENLPTQAKNSRTGKTMYDSIRDYLAKHGTVEETEFNELHINALRGMWAIAGEECRSVLRTADLNAFGSLSGFFDGALHRLGDIYLFNVLSQDDIVTGHLLFDRATQNSVLFNAEKYRVFQGKLLRLSDLFQVLRLTGIKSSF